MNNWPAPWLRSAAVQERWGPARPGLCSERRGGLARAPRTDRPPSQHVPGPWGAAWRTSPPRCSFICFTSLSSSFPDSLLEESGLLLHPHTRITRFGPRGR